MRHAIALLGLLVVGCGGTAFGPGGEASSSSTAGDDGGLPLCVKSGQLGCGTPLHPEAGAGEAAPPPEDDAGGDSGWHLPPVDGGAGDAAPTDDAGDSGPDFAACTAAACAGSGRQCGMVTTACDGVQFTADCGGCAAPAVCGDPLPYQCSSSCVDQFASECGGYGQYQWGTDSSCDGTPYQMVAGQPVFRPGGSAGCVVPPGTSFLCCP